VATNINALLVTGPESGIDVDERGTKRDHDGGSDAGGAVWTGSAADGGSFKSFDCSRWSAGGQAQQGVSGTIGSAGVAWTAACARTCNTAAALYCIEQ